MAVRVTREGHRLIFSFTGADAEAYAEAVLTGIGKERFPVRTWAGVSASQQSQRSASIDRRPREK